ncbi:methyltransferase - protein [Pochonia chlamydosporia 170]|uniref:Methyltransferase - protein n=1 Tax=Pochonia chlamydosporia 170 TaxID=1380566 RepID=A0A179FB32_METCM|nr:methyltransferase - protein [Pochonia chlamydosporia 170]OAQ62674.1 methyltransferase - protein [Pochonia chlamydosporia 170]
MAVADNENTPQPAASEGENERLQINHHVVKLAMGGSLLLAPFDVTRPNLKILDSGTSDGYWLTEFRKTLTRPETCTMNGFDITDERFPDPPPKGIALRVQDVMGPFPDSWLDTFDVVHQRFVLAATATKGREAVLGLCNLVKPGGWIQLVEMQSTVGEDDGPAVHQFVELINELHIKIGAPRNLADAAVLEGHIMAAGFQRVGTMQAPGTLGAKVPDPNIRATAIKSTLDSAASLLGANMGLPGGLQSMSDDEASTFLERLEIELIEYGGSWPISVVWGQKPAK